MAESSRRQPFVPEPCHELGQFPPALIWYPALLAGVLGRAGRVSAPTSPRMRDYRAERSRQSRIFSF